MNRISVKKVGDLSMDKKEIKKVVLLILVAVLMMVVAALLPGDIVEIYMVPAIFGGLFSSILGKAPDLLINQILHTLLFLPLFILYSYILTPAAGFAYLAGVILQKAIYKFAWSKA